MGAGAGAGAEGALRVSIVVVSWNTRDILLDALGSVLPFPGSVGGEVIVVDNASHDGSPDAVRTRFPAVRVIENEANLGFAAGVNIGLRAAREPWVLLLNPDTVARGDLLASLLRYAREHPEAGVIGPRVLNEDGSLQDSRFRFPSLLRSFLAATYLYKLFPASPFFNQERMGGAPASEPQRVDAVSGCCFLVRRELAERLGGLDESYFMYAEETDFCFRAWRSGFEVHYAPVGEIVHFGGASSRLARRRNFLELRRSLLRFHRKNRGALDAQLARLLLLLWLLLRLPYWSLQAARGAPDAREQLGNYLAGMRFLARPLRAILDDGPRPARA